MDRSFSNQLDVPDHAAIREGVRAVVTRFDDEYWLARDEDGEFPRQFHRAMADAGWLGITMPEEYGGSGLGVTEAAIMMHEVASHGGGMTSSSAVHINLFGPHPIVVKGTDDQKRRWVPRLVSGEDQCCFGFTEPDAGLNTTRIKTFAEKVPGGYRVHGQKVWTSTAQVANKIMLLTRTTKFEDCKRPTDGITIFYTDLDRSKIEVRRIPKMGRKAVDCPGAHRVRSSDRSEPGHSAPTGRALDVSGGGMADGDARRLALRHGEAMRRRSQQRQVSGRARRSRCGVASHHDPRRLRLRQGVSRRATIPRSRDYPPCADHGATDSEFHCREGARFAEELLIRRLLPGIRQRLREINSRMISDVPP